MKGTKVGVHIYLAPGRSEREYEDLPRDSPARLVLINRHQILYLLIPFLIWVGFSELDFLKSIRKL